MTARTVRLALFLALLLLIALPMAAWAAPAKAPDAPTGITCLGARSDIDNQAGADFIDWKTLPTSPDWLRLRPKAFDFTSNAGANIHVAKLQSGPFVLAAADKAWIATSNYNDNANYIDVSDFGGQLVFAGGARISSIVHGDFQAQLTAFDANGVALGSCVGDGFNTFGTFTAPVFLGVQSTSPIAKLEFNLVPLNPKPWGYARYIANFAIDQVSFVATKALTASKTAAASYSEGFTWGGLTKTVVGPSVIKAVGGGTADFGFSVSAKQTGFGDTNWKVAGNVTVHNPNAYAITGVSIADVIVGDTNASCSFAPTVFPVSVPAGDTAFAYTCTWAAGKSPKTDPQTNQATVTWAAGQSAVTSATASAQVIWTLVTPTFTDKTFVVKDGATTLFTLTGNKNAPASGSAAVSKTYVVPDWGCQDYKNTVNGDSTTFHLTADATVTACGPVQTGAQDIEFWASPTGQGIVATYCQPADGVWLGRYLRQYRTFWEMWYNDCNSLSEYVEGVETGGRLSGLTPANWQLKAQFLAAALNVYYSDPALCGSVCGAADPLGAAALAGPIGAVAIDLSQVYVSDPSAPYYTDSSPAFNSTAIMTVSEMLDWASHQATLAGYKWYAGNLDLMSKARAAFLAVNTQVAFDN
jgi:hypothetical protein